MPSGRDASTVDELLQINSARNLDIIEHNCKIADMNIYIKVYKEKLDQFKNEVEKAEIECKYLSELRDSKRQLFEEVKLRDKRTNELIKTNTYNKELSKDLLDIRKEKALEIKKQNELIHKQRIEIYEELIKNFARKPLVIKRDKLRNEVDKQKFKCAHMKQKIFDLKRVYKTLQETEKQIEQKRIIKFAQNMVNYYKKQKEQQQIDKQNLNKTNTEQTMLFNNSQRHAEPLTKDISTLGNSSQYDYIFKKQLPTDISSEYILSTTQNTQSIETPIKPIQSLSFNLNYHFDPTKYLNTSVQNLKPTELKHKEPAKKVLSNILNIPKPNFISTMPKFEYSFEKLKTNTLNQKISSIQSEPGKFKQLDKNLESKRQSEFQESSSKQKVAKVSNKKDVKTDVKTAVETEDRIFLSLPDSRNSSQYKNSSISLSQDSQKSQQTPKSLKTQKKALPKTIHETTKMEDTNLQTVNQNQFIVNPKETAIKTDISHPIKQNQNVMPHMFNSPAKLPHKSAANAQHSAEPNRQSSSFNPSLNPMFNLQASKQLMSPKPSETKSPYFATQTQTQEEQNITSSAEQSDKIVNISSDRPSQISADYNSEEFCSANDQMEAEQMEEDRPTNFNNEGYNVMEYFEDNPEYAAMISEQYTSPPDIPSFMTPPRMSPAEQNLEQIPTTSNNIFGAAQSAGNNFFGFGQSNPKSNIFKMF